MGPGWNYIDGSMGPKRLESMTYGKLENREKFNPRHGRSPSDRIKGNTGRGSFPMGWSSPKLAETRVAVFTVPARGADCSSLDARCCGCDPGARAKRGRGGPFVAGGDRSVSWRGGSADRSRTSRGVVAHQAPAWAPALDGPGRDDQCEDQTDESE